MRWLSEDDWRATWALLGLAVLVLGAAAVQSVLHRRRDDGPPPS